MTNLRQLQQDILANGKVEGNEIALLRAEIYADGKIDRNEADWLVELHKRVQRVTPAFEQFFYQAIKDHLLGNGGINAEQTRWIRQMIGNDGNVNNDEKKFLRELRGEAKQSSSEFEALCQECLK